MNSVSMFKFRMPVLCGTHGGLKVQTCMYKEGQFVLLDRDELDLTFGKLTDTAVVSDCEVFGVQQYSTVYFDGHHNSFVVEPTGIFKFVPRNTVPYYHPLNARYCHVASSKNSYISISQCIGVKMYSVTSVLIHLYYHPCGFDNVIQCYAFLNLDTVM